MSSKSQRPVPPDQGARRAPTADDLVRFRDAARRAAQVADEVRGELFAGMTEAGAARTLAGRCLAAGATGYLVEPRVLFGERTTLPRVRRTEDPRPGWNTLDVGEAFLFEAVPLLGGIPAPLASFGGLLGRPEGIGAGERLLAEVRDAIPRAVDDGASGLELARFVQQTGSTQGWRDATRPRAGWALARRIERMPAALASPTAPWGGAALESTRLGLFGLRRRAPAGRRPAPIWSDDPGADTPVAHGLWLVSPRFARGPLAVLSREFLWVDEDGARWLVDGPLPRSG